MNIHERINLRHMMAMKRTGTEVSRDVLKNTLQVNKGKAHRITLCNYFSRFTGLSLGKLIKTNMVATFLHQH
jgi:hypothetical protein